MAKSYLWGIAGTITGIVALTMLFVVFPAPTNEVRQIGSIMLVCIGAICVVAAEIISKVETLSEKIDSLKKE